MPVTGTVAINKKMFEEHSHSYIKTIHGIILWWTDKYLWMHLTWQHRQQVLTENL